MTSYLQIVPIIHYLLPCDPYLIFTALKPLKKQRKQSQYIENIILFP